MYQVPAVASAARLLFHLQGTGGAGDTLSACARALTLSKSTTHNILKTLAGHGLVAYDPATRHYRLGPALVGLGREAGEGWDFMRVARPYLEALVAEVRFACLVAQLTPGGQIAVVDKAESRQEVKITVAVGERFPITAPALGRCFLAWLSPAAADRLVADAGGLTRFTEHSITDPQAWRQSLDRVRELGYSWSVEEYYLRAHALAAPVFDVQGQVAFAICCLAYAPDLPAHALHAHGRRLRQVADRISQATGGTVPPQPLAIHKEGSLHG